MNFSVFQRAGALLLSGALLCGAAPALAAQADGTVTRGEFTSQLWIQAGSPAVQTAAPFTDIQADEANYAAILWAAEADVVNGNGMGSFFSDDALTREQLAVMLYQYAQANGDGMILTTDLSGCSDWASVSPWAETALSWAVAKGYLTAEDGLLDPQGTVSVQESQRILDRYDEMAPHNHSLGLTGVVNGRQLGGYLTADGRRVKDNVLLRTGKMSGATEDDVQALAETYHVTQIVDFRSASEFTQDPDPELPGCVNTNLPVISEEELAGAMTAEDMANMNEMVKVIYNSFATSEQAISAYTQFFDLLLNHKDGAILWHCTAGQDRAGVAAYLLLVALGVDEDTARQDYLTSIDFAGSVQPEWLDTFLAAVQEHYGDVHGYLTQALGLTEAELAQLQDMYLE